MSSEHECWKSSEEAEGTEAAMWAIAAGLFAIADAQIKAAHLLGNGGAATPMGAIEAFGAHIGEKMDGLADAIRNLAEYPRSAISQGPESVLRYPLARAGLPGHSCRR